MAFYHFILQLAAMAVRLYMHDQYFRLSRRKSLKQFIHYLFESEQRKLEALQYIFCSDDYLLTFNQQYLQHNTFTDIITFNFSEKDKKIKAEIYISIDRVIENAKKFKVSFENELYRVMFHGALHLCGYGDKTKDEKATMKKKENEYLLKYKKLINF